MNNMFFFDIDDIDKEKEKLRKAQLYSMSEHISILFWDEFPRRGLEVREGQQDMAFEIVDALMNNRHLMVEAGVGIGKSFGYLVPALLYNKYIKKPVIIATSTIALQEQLWHDACKIKSILKLKNNIILAKGQTHYLCNKRARQYVHNNSEADISEVIRNGMNHGYGEYKDFTETLPRHIWDKISVQDFSIKKCGFCRKKCKYYKIREALKSTNGIVLCNQDFLTQHLIKLQHGQNGLINPADFLIVDEAHNLDDKVRSAITEHFGQNMLFKTIENSVRELNPVYRSRIYKKEHKAQNAITNFYNCLKQQIETQINEADQDIYYADRFFFNCDDYTIKLLNKMNIAIRDLSSDIQIYSSMNVKKRHSLSTSDKLNTISIALSQLYDQIDNMLIWIEKDCNNIQLAFCPKNTKDIINSLYFKKNSCTVLTSATLTNAATGTLKEQYSYFINNTGFPEGTRGFLSEPKPSPYPYDEHAIIYYCDDLPHPTAEHQAFIERGVARLIEILNISNGKALVLFTAKTDMDEVYSILNKKNLPYKILIQRRGASQDTVLNEFKKDTNSVLLGTGAYWEGISIEGKALSNVIIFRLPFPVPDPIIEHKCSIAKDALMDVCVPEMIIKLKQGIGRLIRNFTDTGMVCIIDRRLRDNPPERYHDITWNSLPIKNRTSSLIKLREFYNNLPTIKSDKS